VYGDHPHAPNDGTQLDGGIAHDCLWQSWHHRMAQIAPACYSVPKGAVGKRFLTILTHKLAQARNQEWNLECLLVFVAVVLQISVGIRQSKDVRLGLVRRMDLWAVGPEGCSTNIIGTQATTACDNLNLCAGLPGGGFTPFRRCGTILQRLHRRLAQYRPSQ
jgi:hypothetical protein